MVGYTVILNYECICSISFATERENSKIPSKIWGLYLLVVALPGKCVNLLAPGKFKYNFIHVILKQILVIDGWDISCEIALIYMSRDFTDDQSTLVQVMDWCHQATSHYLSQCWPTSLSPYGVTRPQWVNWLGWKVKPITGTWSG